MLLHRSDWIMLRLPSLLSVHFRRCLCRRAIFNHRIDLQFENLRPLGNVLSKECRVVSLQQMPTQNRTWHVPAAHGLESLGLDVLRRSSLSHVPLQPKIDFAFAQFTLEPTKVIAFTSTTPRKSLPLFITTKCAGTAPMKTPDAVQSGLTV